MVEARMTQRERTPLALEELRDRHGKPLRMAEPVAGRVHRGQLVGYGEDDIPALTEATLPQHRVTKLSPRPVELEDLAALFGDSMRIW